MLDFCSFRNIVQDDVSVYYKKITKIVNIKFLHYVGIFNVKNKLTVFLQKSLDLVPVHKAKQ